MILGKGGKLDINCKFFYSGWHFLPKNTFISHNSGNKTMKKLFKKFKSY